jgi:hypothetical protein
VVERIVKRRYCFSSADGADKHTPLVIEKNKILVALKMSESCPQNMW